MKILDCTLRDGGYVNEWHFGTNNIKKIISALEHANIDIIECGFLTDYISYHKDITKFNRIDEIDLLLKDNNSIHTEYVCMLNYGEYKIENIPDRIHSSIAGIRVAFHKRDMENALNLCSSIKEKGYKIYVQPMVSLNYSDDEFLELIHRVNKINPFSFYIVDSFGSMTKNQLLHLYTIVKNNLEPNIMIGYHAHNNLQLAYSNAQMLIEISEKNNLIIDSSIMGIGRGAGNLNTELLAECFNSMQDKKYKVQPLLKAMDEVLNDIYMDNYWGYSLPQYISAINQCHPNYATFLNDKKTLGIEEINEIIISINKKMKNDFDRDYIEQLYTKYLSRHGIIKSEYDMKDILKDKCVIVIAPGRSISHQEKEIVTALNEKNNVSISINFEFNKYPTDYIFFSNKRKYDAMEKKDDKRYIFTSNVIQNSQTIAEYDSLINEKKYVSDNAGLMLIQFLINQNVKEIIIAGMDGYDLELENNYVQGQEMILKNKEWKKNVNDGLKSKINDYRKQIPIHFITKSILEES